MLIDPNPAVHAELFKRFKVVEEDRRETLLRSRDVRAGQASLTSCAWFFDDFGGLEGRVALRWPRVRWNSPVSIRRVSRASCSSRLRESISNRRENGDAAICT